MAQFKKTRLIYLYIITLILIYIMSINISTASAMTGEVEYIGDKDIVYTIELGNEESFDSVKRLMIKNTLKEDPKYLLKPDELKDDIDSSSILITKMDLESRDKQRIEFTISRDKFQETAVDQLKGEAMVKLEDTTAPEIKLKKDKVVLKHGAKFKADDYIESIKDNVDGHVDYEIEGKIDTEKSGDQKLTYKAEDSSGNKSTKTLEVTVKKKPKPKVVEKVEVSAPPLRSVKPVNFTALSDDGSSNSLLNKINHERSIRGIGPLSMMPEAYNRAANVRAQEVSTGLIGHTRPNGTGYQTAFSEQGVDCGNGVEIVVSGGSLDHMIILWLNSPVHARNMLSPSYSKVAIGVSNGSAAAILW